MLLPGVAFTKNGDRLGHGGSFYDTFLCNYKAKFGTLPFMAALSLKEQLVDSVPTTDRDVAIDCVVAPDIM